MLLAVWCRKSLLLSFSVILSQTQTRVAFAVEQQVAKEVDVTQLWITIFNSRDSQVVKGMETTGPTDLKVLWFGAILSHKDILCWQASFQESGGNRSKSWRDLVHEWNCFVGVKRKSVRIFAGTMKVMQVMCFALEGQISKFYGLSCLHHFSLSCIWSLVISMSAFSHRAFCFVQWDWACCLLPHFFAFGRLVDPWATPISYQRLDTRLWCERAEWAMAQSPRDCAKINEAPHLDTTWNLAEEKSATDTVSLVPPKYRKYPLSLHLPARLVLRSRSQTAVPTTPRLPRLQLCDATDCQSSFSCQVQTNWTKDGTSQEHRLSIVNLS